MNNPMCSVCSPFRRIECEGWQVFSNDEGNPDFEIVRLVYGKDQLVWGERVEKIYNQVKEKQPLGFNSVEDIIDNEKIPEAFCGARGILFFGTVYKHPRHGLGVLGLNVIENRVSAWDDFVWYEFELEMIPFSTALFNSYWQSAIAGE
jgi:hypothetical protein